MAKFFIKIRRKEINDAVQKVGSLLLVFGILMIAAELSCWAGLQDSSYYYNAFGSPKGLRPSTHSVNQDGALWKYHCGKGYGTNPSQEFCCYGYRNMTGELKEKGWIINHKKLYQLMREHKLSVAVGT